MSHEPDARALVIGDIQVGMGESCDITLTVSERYTGSPVGIPIRVIRAARPGPTLFVTAAVHGDERNGTGVVRRIMSDHGHPLIRGTLLLVPVLNILGMEQHSRYLPDRRDLNRSFPGSPNGSLASRIAQLVFKHIVKNSDFGIDIHTAATGRTNFPHIRADLEFPELNELTRAFGAAVILTSRGDRRTLRAAACHAGCPTMVLEAGEPLKIEPSVVEVGVRGVLNVLKSLRMIEGEPDVPIDVCVAERSVWVRSRAGGLLRFHVASGQVVHRGEAMATVDNLFVQRPVTIVAPVGGVVIGLRTLPVVKPGDPICHIAIPTETLSQTRQGMRAGALHERVRVDQRTGITITAAPPTHQPLDKKSGSTR